MMTGIEEPTVLDLSYLDNSRATNLAQPEPPPLEQIDPELGEHLRLIANRCHPVVKTLVVQADGIMLVAHDGTKQIKRDRPVKAQAVGRNDPCPCGSGKKFKKCCA